MLILRSFGTLLILSLGWILYSLFCFIAVGVAHALLGVTGLVGSVIGLFLLTSALAERYL